MRFRVAARIQDVVDTPPWGRHDPDMADDVVITFGDDSHGEPLGAPTRRGQDVFVDLAACLERSGEQSLAEYVLEMAEHPPERVGAELNDILEDVLDRNPGAVRCVGDARRAAAGAVRRPVVLAAQALAGVPGRCLDPRRTFRRGGR